VNELWEDVEPRLKAFLARTIYVRGAPAPVARVGLLPRIYVHALLGEEGRVILAEEATAWGKTHSDVVGAAFARTSAREVSLVPIAPDTGAKIFRLAPFEESSSMLLAPGFLDSLSARLGGPAVCAIPTGHVLLATNGDDLEQVAGLYELARELWLTSDLPLSPVLYVQTPEGFVEPYFAEDEGGPIFDAASRAERLLEARTYDDQKRAFESMYEEGTPLPIMPDLDVVPLPGAGWTTSTVMMDDREALLPMAENLFLSFEGPTSPRRMLVPQAALERVAPGCLLVLPDYDPPRQLVVRFPNAAELEALYEVALLKDEGPLDDAPEGPEPAPGESEGGSG